MKLPNDQERDLVHVERVAVRAGEHAPVWHRAGRSQTKKGRSPFGDRPKFREASNRTAQEPFEAG